MTITISPDDLPELVADLVETLGEVRKQLPVGVDVAAIEKAMAVVVETSTGMATQLKTHQETLERLSAAVPTDGTIWPTELDQVDEWVETWLKPVFPFWAPMLARWTEIPCYVSELAAAYAGYRQMTATKASGFDKMQWHSMVNQTMERIQRYKADTPTAAAAALFNPRLPVAGQTIDPALHHGPGRPPAPLYSVGQDGVIPMES